MMTGQPKITFFGFPKMLQLTRMMFPAYSWSCFISDGVNVCGSYDPDTIVKTLEEKVTEIMSRVETELSEAKQLINEMLKGGDRK